MNVKKLYPKLPLMTCIDDKLGHAPAVFSQIGKMLIWFTNFNNS